MVSVNRCPVGDREARGDDAMLIVLLTVVGALEAVVYLWRYRSANGSGAKSSAMSAGAVQVLRVSGIGGIASAVDSGEWLWPAVAYVSSAVIVTYIAHSVMNTRSRGATP